MRLLLDANLSPRLVGLLSDAGYDVVHVGNWICLTAPDPVIFDRAVDDGYVVITADTDFSMLLALRCGHRLLRGYFCAGSRRPPRMSTGGLGLKEK